MCPSCGTVCERALVGTQRSRPARQPPTSPQLTSQIHPGRTAHDPTVCNDERLRAFPCAHNLRLQTTAICSEASKCMQQQVQRPTPKPLFRDTVVQRSERRERACPDNRRQEPAGPGRRISGQNRHTEWHHHSQQSCPAQGKSERGQSRGRSLNVVNRWIALRHHPSGSRSSEQAQRWVEVPLAAIWALDIGRSLTPNCGWSDSCSKWLSRCENHCNDMGWRWWQSSAINEPPFDGWHIWCQALASG